jgi:K+-sensing histidine kinase KdpD
MIMGEGLVFALSIIGGLILINRAFWKELELNKNTNNFLLSVTHELKTPLSTLSLINKTLINKDLPEGKQKELLATAMEESSRLESLVNNILTAAQMEQHYVFNFESTDLTALIAERIDRYGRLNPDYAFEFNASDNCHLEIDKEAFVKLIDNLLDNAVKYSPSGSRISVSLAQMGNKVVLRFTDMGSGIADTEKTRVLEKFYRIGNEETRETKGTGLGLFIVREIVAAHKGKMSISDNHPNGTIIEIRLNNN